ncbi:MAG TPA: alkaline phosphatase family protein [Bryobacteraceae bacterium]|nr:alkaline phosphatase family protein [Bryobacteraceae bacterium]
MRSALWICLLGAVALGGCGKARTNAAAKRVVVLGIDAMDPAFLERHWSDLPNLDRLRREGEFKRLGTTIPPQSPVAWSTFITGLNPGGHGVYDFIHRNPATMALFSSMAETEPPKWTLPVGPYRIPLSGGRVTRFRQGQAFWELLDAHGVPATLLRMPNNFPPVESRSKSLSGMGTPDMLGTFGTFTFFSDEPGERERTVPGGRIVPVALDNEQADLVIQGPENTLRKDRRRSSVTLKVTRDAENSAALFEVADTRFVMNEGEWSDWVRLKFPLIPGVTNAHGMVRIYAKRLRPEFRVYVSPVNLDPASPDLPISTPSDYSAELAAALGPFYTQGIAEDTSAMREGVLSAEEYRAQSALVAREQFAMLRHALKESAGGLVFIHFLGIDQDSHVFWGKREADLLETYKRVDREIGNLLPSLRDATVIVMSDHGFSEFRRAVNLNTWLMQEGFLALDSPSNTGSAEGFAHVDWKRTQAYSLGLNGVYVNAQGREKAGSVAAGEVESIVDRIASRLLELRDPESGDRVVAAAYKRREIYRGDALAYAPDLVVGWNAGYRSSWQTALGAVPPAVIEDNTDEWRGDHCIAAHLVPGVFLSNRRAKVADPKLEDITVTVLKEFGIAPGPGMMGRAVF